jgi:S1-C subfamily serine protease
VRPSGTSLEGARSATVLIKTGWGLGSGFIIDAQCHIITNRHVVETDGNRVANNVLQDPATQQQLALAQQRLMLEINKEEAARRALEGQPGTHLQQAELDQHLAQLQAQLTELTVNLQQGISQKVEGSGRSGFTAVLVDGREFKSLHAEFASNLDLALFQLPATDCPHIPVGTSMGLALGQRLYTIGNPSGLTYTVTSGVFSGQRSDGRNRLLQTDAPINPGNSGGPLLTEDGRVIGINSMVMRGTQGIGFAIPIEAAFDEFPQLAGARP